MKKRIVCLLLACFLVLGMLPALGTSAVEVDETDQIFTVEKYDENGNGSFLVLPKRAAKASNYTYGSTWIANAIGSSIVQHDGSYITAIKDDTQEDGWLNNGDIVNTSQWIVSASSVCYLDTSWFYAYEAKVVRIIFSPSGIGSELDLSDAGWADIGTMAVNKDSLIDLVSRYTVDDFAEGSAQATAYQAALDTILDLNATAEDVAAAQASFENALKVPATGITLTCDAGAVLEEDVLTLGVNQSATLTAVLTPADSTDTVTWSIADPSVAEVDQNGRVTGLKQNGETTLTARANDEVSKTITVSVTRVPATGITLADAEVEVGKTITLEPVVTPDGYTDRVTWSVADRDIATVDANGRVTALRVGETTVTAAVNGYTATAKLTVNGRQDPYVYFEYSDGSVQQMVDGTFTLSSLDEGYFRVANTDAAPWWENEEVLDAGQGSVTYHWYVNRETGAWQPSGLQPTKPITVTAGDFTQSFEIIYQETSGVEALRVYVMEDGQPKYLDTEANPYVVTGCIWYVPVYTEGLIDGHWVEIPVQALNYDTSDNVYYNFRFVGNEMIIDRAGEATMTVSLKGEDVSTSFKAVCNPVYATAMEVVVPEVCYIDEWQDNGQHYVGVRPYTGYQIDFTPANATNRDVTWESLTPDIAVHSDLHNDGIIPYKAGTAQFIVTNTADPTLTQAVTVTFVYKNPLTAASTEEAYYMTAGSAMDLTIDFTPSNATEQRFTWTYSQDGIVAVTDKIESDESGTVSWTTHQIEALQEGFVTVTGTPYDQTGSCQPITFTVTVGEGIPEEPADIEKIVSEGIADSLGVLLNAYAGWEYEYGDEWAVFLLTRTGNNLTQEQIAHYLETVVAAYTDPTAAELKPTTIARVILGVSVLGQDASDLDGINLIALLCSSTQISNGSNEPAWALIALDSCDYTVPEGAVWTREKLIDEVLKYQNPDNGGFGFSDNMTYVDADLTAMCIQGLAPYYTTNETVKDAVDAALVYLQSQMDRNCDFGSSETISQVLIALTALELDPLDEANGFVKSVARNLLTALDAYRVAGSGFKHDRNSNEVNNLASVQALQALVAYNRYRNGQTALYDLTDVSKSDKPTQPEPNPAPETGSGDSVDSIPKTGDETNLILPSAGLIISLFGFTAMLTLRKKKHIAE